MSLYTFAYFFYNSIIMTRDVWIFIRGLQNTGTDDAEPVEVISAGTYYNRNGKHYVLYDQADDASSMTANLVKIGSDFVELNRKGSQAVRMVFRQGVRTSAEYPTPCGRLLLGVDTRSVRIGETNGQIEVQMEYTLDADGDRISSCELTMRISPRTDISE
ncbi:MAG: DUF1934 domain-containing protein [Clostridiales bacterium]|nr:DUF1934 domain-containing protein [Clostridiales bacterium]